VHWAQINKASALVEAVNVADACHPAGERELSRLLIIKLLYHQSPIKWLAVSITWLILMLCVSW